MDVSLVSFDPQSASPEEWARFHTFRRIRHEERNPGDSLTEDARSETWMRRGDPEAHEIRFAAYYNGFRADRASLSSEPRFTPEKPSPTDLDCPGGSGNP